MTLGNTYAIISSAPFRQLVSVQQQPFIDIFEGSPGALTLTKNLVTTDTLLARADIESLMLSAGFEPTTYWL